MNLASKWVQCIYFPLILGTVQLNLTAVSWAQEMPRLISNAGHSSSVTSVAISPDGRYVASGGRDKVIKVWALASGRLLRNLTGHSNWITSVVFTGDGTRLLSTSNDQTSRVWSLENGREISRLTGHTHVVNSAALSKDSTFAYTGGGDFSIRKWNLKEGLEILRFPDQPGWVLTTALSHDEMRLATAGTDASIHLWTSNDGHELKSFWGHKNWVTSLKFSLDDKKLASGSSDGTVRIWDINTSQELRQFGQSLSPIRAISFDPTGAILAAADGTGGLRAWNFDNGKEIGRLANNGVPVNAFAFSLSGPDIVFGDEMGLVKIWDTSRDYSYSVGQPLHPINYAGFDGHNESITFLQDGLAARQYSFSTSLLGEILSDKSGNISALDTNSTSGGKATAVGLQDGRILFFGSNDFTKESAQASHGASVTAIAVSPNGQIAAAGGADGLIRVLNYSVGTESFEIGGHFNQVRHIVFSRDGRYLAALGNANRVIVASSISGKVTAILTGEAMYIDCLAFAPDGKHIIVGDRVGRIHELEIGTGQLVRSMHKHSDWVSSIAFSPNGKFFVTGSADNTIRLWDYASGKQLRTLSGHGSSVRSTAFSPDGRLVLSGSHDGTIKFWHVSSGLEIATLTPFADNTWVVTDPEGRFDTADLESMPHLHWVMPDDPFTAVPLEVFMKDYYEPRLLARILAGETFKPVRPLTSLNRTQPEVQITSVVPEGSDPSLVNVTVSATGATKSYLQGEKEVPRPTAVHELRLFRDGQMMGYADGKLADFKGAAFSKTFTVRLPKDKAGKDVVFSAYAFNDDRVKSETVRSTFKAPALPSSTVASKGKAYVISMGVNSHDNAAWNLNFAANDARLVRQSVSEKLAKSSQYKEVIAITLVSDKKDQQASKAALHAVLDRLSGKPLDAAATTLLQNIQGADKLQTVTPDDLFLLSFSGHGFADDSGNFYLIPQDTGRGTGKAVTAELRQHSISSEELSQWLRDVDAGDMTMIVDACQSAATVGNDFKPGPMGSRGLGQLSFDKGMRILAASQSDEVALEDRRIEQGLLSYALVRDGLDQKKADYLPVDKKITLKEWLSYGVSRVPSLADDVKSGKLVAARSAVSVSADGKVMKAVTQKPSLFDFTKDRRDVVLEAGIH